MRTSLSIALGLVVALAAPSAFAQDAPPSGIGADPQPQPTEPVGTLPPPAVVTTTVQTPVVAPAAAVVPEEEPLSDHEKVVGHVAVGYMGLTSVPLAAGGGIPASVNAPVIGVRYWLAEKIGLDLGLGLGFTTGSTETVAGATTTVTDAPGVFGAAIHGGVPLVFAHQKHYKFLIIPELNIGIASATRSQGPNQPDVSHSGFLFNAGARIGSEIHFGFIGVPQLALQASVGLFLAHQSTKQSAEANGVTNSASSSSFGLGTSVQSDPWALFANNISALYYFP